MGKNGENMMKYDENIGKGVTGAAGTVGSSEKPAGQGQPGTAVHAAERIAG